MKGRKARMRAREARKGGAMPPRKPTTVRKGKTKMEKPKADTAHHTASVPSSEACAGRRQGVDR